MRLMVHLWRAAAGGTPLPMASLGSTAPGAPQLCLSAALVQCSRLQELKPAGGWGRLCQDGFLSGPWQRGWRCHRDSRWLRSTATTRGGQDATVQHLLRVPGFWGTPSCPLGSPCPDMVWGVVRCSTARFCSSGCWLDLSDPSKAIIRGISCRVWKYAWLGLVLAPYARSQI